MDDEQTKILIQQLESEDIPNPKIMTAERKAFLKKVLYGAVILAGAVGLGIVLYRIIKPSNPSPQSSNTARFNNETYTPPTIKRKSSGRRTTIPIRDYDPADY